MFGAGEFDHSVRSFSSTYKYFLYHLARTITNAPRLSSRRERQDFTVTGWGAPRDRGHEATGVEKRLVLGRVDQCESGVDYAGRSTNRWELPDSAMYAFDRRPGSLASHGSPSPPSPDNDNAQRSRPFVMRKSALQQIPLGLSQIPRDPW